MRKLNMKLALKTKIDFWNSHNKNKCEGPIPLGKTCNASLEPEVNYTNCYCWNCVYKYALKNGNLKLAQEVVDIYL